MTDTVDGDDVDALVQVGTNLAMARLAPAAEAWLGKSVIAINTAICRAALRSAGRPVQPSMQSRRPIAVAAW